MNCINLPEFRVIKAEENEFDYRFTVETIEEPDFCPQCFYSTDSPRYDGKPFIKHGIKDREVWDLDMHGKRVKLVIKQRRYKCPVCGGTFYELLNSVAPNAKITTRLYKSIQLQGLDGRFTEIAERYGISNMTVRRAVDDFIEENDKKRILIAPRVIGIDEAHLNKAMRAVITNIEKREIIELLPTNTKRDVKAFIKSLEGYKDIEVATMDMATSYRYAMYELVPDVLCIIDKYHVIQYAIRALDRIRIDYKNSLPEEQRKKLFNDKWTLSRNKEDLDDEAKSKRDYWFSMFPTLATAYWLKEGLRDVYKAKDRYEAFQMYYQWESSIPDEMKPFKEVAATINKCKKEVFNYFLTPARYTNAYTESLNNIIKRIEKFGVGYSFDILRAKILYSTNATKKPAYGEHGFRVIDKFSLGTNCNKDYEYRGFGVDITTLLKIMDEGKF